MTDNTDSKQAQPEQTGHKNPPVGPKTSAPLPDWRKDRDYEQFMPSPNM